ncbi:hypothetical protein J2X14_000805 [Pantoea alhagi]|uniref:hypothetical protein n=1 Tax=Mixta sp. BE291 TaxID=3158787 RepID=UPI002854C46C|nr:hypothetical protein [Pantoea alhagi]
MATRSARNDASGNVTVFIRGGKSGSHRVSRRAIAQSAMLNARTSFEIEGHRYNDNDWSKIMHIADQLEAVI